MATATAKNCEELPWFTSANPWKSVAGDRAQGVDETFQDPHLAAEHDPNDPNFDNRSI
jgi:hypothetical protein